MCSVHPVFHVSMLEPATFSTFSERIQPAPTPVIIDRESKYEISWIVYSKIDCWWACKLLYKMIWLGYEDTGDESELTYAANLVSDFHITYSTKPGSLLLSWSRCCTCPLSPCIFQWWFFFINSLVYSICLLSSTHSFYTLFGVSFQNFQTSFHFISWFSYSHI